MTNVQKHTYVIKTFFYSFSAVGQAAKCSQRIWKWNSIIKIDLGCGWFIATGTALGLIVPIFMNVFIWQRASWVMCSSLRGHQLWRSSHTRKFHSSLPGFDLRFNTTIKLGELHPLELMQLSSRHETGSREVLLWLGRKGWGYVDIKFKGDPHIRYMRLSTLFQNDLSDPSPITWVKIKPTRVVKISIWHWGWSYDLPETLMP